MPRHRLGLVKPIHAMSTTPDSHPKAPYLSFTTFKNFVGSLGEAALPTRIDKSVMLGQSGGTQSYLLGAMRFFGLIDEACAPQQSLRRLTAAAKDEAQFRAVWREIVEPAYAPVTKRLDLQRSTTSQLHEILNETYDYRGDTLRKSHAFFLAALDAAGVEVGAHLKAVGKVAATRKRSKPNVAQSVRFAWTHTANGLSASTVRRSLPKAN
jgi:hypothetical protein